MAFTLYEWAGRTSVVELLLSKKADPNRPSPNTGHPILSCAIAVAISAETLGEHLAVVRALVTSRASITETAGEDVQSPLHLAQLLDSEHVVTQFLEACQCWNPLMHAVAQRQPIHVRQLLRKGADDPSARISNAASSEPDTTAMSLAINQPEYRWSLEVCPTTLNLIQRSLRWSPFTHELFPLLFRRSVRFVLLLHQALDNQGSLPLLPPNVWFEIISWLPRDWIFYLPID